MKTLTLISGLVCLAFAGFADINDHIGTNKNSEIEHSQSKGYDVLMIHEQGITDEIGKPQLPVKIYTYLIPVDKSIDNVVINSSTKSKMVGSFYIYPAQPPIPLDGCTVPEFVEPDPSVYNSNNPYPGKLYDIINEEISCGYKLVTIRFYPVEYLPLDKEIYVYDNIDYTIQLKNATNIPVQSEFITKRRYDLIRKQILSIVKNTDYINQLPLPG